MNEDEILKKLKGLEYTPSKEVDDRISWMLRNSYEKEKIDVTKSQDDGNKRQSNLFLNNFKMKYKIFALIIAPVATLGILSVLGILFVYPLVFPKTDSLKLTPQQKREIYKSILENNSQMQTMSSQDNFKTQEIDQKSTSNKESFQAEPKLNVESKLVPLPGNMDFTNKIITTITTNTVGPKVDECKSIYSPGLISADQFESLSYYDDEGNFVSKNTEYYGNNLVIYYSKSTKNYSENIEYKGGKYAVKSVFNYQPELLETDTMVNEKIVDNAEDQINSNYLPLEDSKNSDDFEIDSLMKKYFGEDIDIVGKEEIDGKEYYILEYSYETECDYDYFSYKTPDFWNGEDYDSQEIMANPTKISIRNYVDIQNFSIARTDTFLGKVDDANLIYSSVTVGSEKVNDIDTASEEIKFDIDVPIKEYNPNKNPINFDQNENKAIIEYLRNNNLPIPQFDTFDYDLSMIYSTGYYQEDPIKDEYTQLIEDRDFFAEGDFGDKLYKQYYGFDNDNEVDYINPLVSMDFVTTGTNQNLNTLYGSVYDGKYSDMDILKTVVYRPVKNKSIEEVDIEINGEQVTAQLYKYKYEYEDIVYEEPVYKDSNDSSSSDPGAASVEENQNIVIDPMPVEGNGKMKKFVDSNYTLIIPLDGGKYKFVVSDYAYDSNEFAPSFDVLTTSRLKVKFANEFSDDELNNLLTWSNGITIDSPVVSEPVKLPR